MLILAMYGVQAQFPTACPTPSEGQCCPSFQNAVCGGADRGVCANVTDPAGGSPCDPAHLPQLKWLTDSYTHFCACKPGFRGVACEKCAYGYQGADCKQKAPLRVRRDFSTLTKAEQDAFIAALLKSKQLIAPYHVPNAAGAVSRYDFLVWVHYFSVMYHPTEDYAHAGPGFLTWHRAYMLALDELLQEVTGDPTYAVPYWNWANPDGKCTAAVLAAFGGDGHDDGICHTPAGGCNCSLTTGPFAAWRTIGADPGLNASHLHPPLKRALGCDPTATTLPSPHALEYAVRYPIYDAAPFNDSTHLLSFRNLMEGFALTPVHTEPMPKHRDLHNRLHIHIGGTMYNVELAASDPLFWPHHAFVDMQFERWIRNQEEHCILIPGPSTGAAAGHNYRECLMPIVPLVTHETFFRNCSQLGYTYDIFGSSTHNDHDADDDDSNLVSSDIKRIAAAASVAASLALTIGVALGFVIARMACCCGGMPGSNTAVALAGGPNKRRSPNYAFEPLDRTESL